MPITDFIKEQLGLGHHEHERQHPKHESSPPTTAGQAYEIKPLSTADLQRTNMNAQQEIATEGKMEVKLNRECGVECEKECTEEQADMIPVTEKDEAAANEMQRLNNILADYKTQMLALESSNRCLTEELSRIRQPLLAFEHHDDVVRETQRTDAASAMEKESQVRTELAKTLAEAEDFKTRFERCDRERQDQLLRANALQELVVKQEADKELMRIQKEEADRQRRELQLALEAVQETMKRVRAELELQRQSREASEMEVQKLQGQFVAYENSVNQLRKQVHEATEVPAVERVQSDLKENVEQIRRDYEQNREQLSMEFEERANKFYNMWLSESKAGDQLRSELAELRGKSDQLIELQREVAQYRSQVDALKQENVIAEQKFDLLQKQYETTTRHCDELKNIVDSERQQIGQKSKLYGEVAVYRDIVEGKLLETNETDEKPITGVNEQHEITHCIQDQEKCKREIFPLKEHDRAGVAH